MDIHTINMKIDDILTETRSKKYLSKENRVSTVADYLALPIEKRTRKHWFWGKMYLMPDGLTMDLNTDQPICGEWGKFYDVIKRDYPIQGFFRITLHDFFQHRHWRIRDRYYDIRNWLFPKQRWLMKGIPNHWQDKRSLSVDLLFKLIVHFIEEENVLNEVVLDDTDEHIAFKQGLVECYKWIKNGRSELQAQIDKELCDGVKSRRHLYKTMDTTIEAYNAVYGPLHQLEAQLEETDTEFCIWIIRNRAFLWV